MFFFNILVLFVTRLYTCHYFASVKVLGVLRVLDVFIAELWLIVLFARIIILIICSLEPNTSPSKVKATAISSSDIQIEWNSVSPINGVLLGYEVR